MKKYIKSTKVIQPEIIKPEEETYEENVDENYIEIDLRKFKVYIIGSTKSENYKNKYQTVTDRLLKKDFDNKNIELFEFIPQKCKSRSLGITFLELLKKVKQQPFQPFIVLEDDADIWHEKFTYSIPSNLDALYLGHSKIGVGDNTSVWSTTNRVYVINENLAQVFNMLSTHAILYLKENYINTLISVLTERYSWDCLCENDANGFCHYDALLAKGHEIHKIYTLRKPVFYQLDDYNMKYTKLIIDTPTIDKEYNKKYLNYTYVSKEEYDLYLRTSSLMKQSPFCKHSHPVTIVSAFYMIPSKRSSDIYKKWMIHFYGKYSKPMVIFTDEENFKFIQTLRKKFYLNTKIILLPFKDLYMQKYRTNFENTNLIDNEKNHTPDLYMIWGEKPFFMKRAANINHFNSEHFIWMDAGYIRGNYLSENFPNLSKVKMYGNKITFLQVASYDSKDTIFLDFNNQTKTLIDKDGILEYAKSKDNDKIVSVGGGFIMANKSNTEWFCEKYEELLQKYFRMNIFAGKDQTLFANIILSDKDKFNIVKMDQTKTYSNAPSDINWFYMLWDLQ